MANRYEDCDDNLVEVFFDVVEKRFPKYANLEFSLIYDTKKRIKQGKVCLASIELPSPKLRFFTKNEEFIEGCDYIIIVDKQAWSLSNDADKSRLIAHQLCHIFIDDKGVLKLIGHDVRDFYSEIVNNEDDPDWNIKLSSLVSSVYEQEKDIKAVKKDL